MRLARLPTKWINSHRRCWLGWTPRASGKCSTAAVSITSLQPPEATIPPEQGDISIDTAIVVRRFFLQDSPAVHALFDALLARLTGRRAEALARLRSGARLAHAIQA